MLDKIRKIMGKYDIPVELIGKMECMACDIYDAVFREREKRKSLLTGKFEKGEEVQRLIKNARDDKLRNPISQVIRDSNVGEQIFIKESEFEGLRTQFAANIHPLVKRHSTITTQYVTGGWIVTKKSNKLINKKL